MRLLSSVGCLTFLLIACLAVPSARAESIWRHGRHAKSSHAASARVATASWYGNEFRGRRTASGARFDPNCLTAASKTLPLGTKLVVANPRNGKSCTVTVNDRGPYVRGRQLDLSRAAARRIGMSGVQPVVYYPTSAPGENIVPAVDTMVQRRATSSRTPAQVAHASSRKRYQIAAKTKLVRFFRHIRALLT